MIIYSTYYDVIFKQILKNDINNAVLNSYNFGEEANMQMYEKA